MDKKEQKRLRKDCLRLMYPCMILHFIKEAMTLVVPTLCAWMIGDMTDALLAMDLESIGERIPLFLLAVCLQVIVLQLVTLQENLLLTQKGMEYDEYLLGRYLRRPLEATESVEGATLVYRLDVDAVNYYFNQIQKWTRPATFLVYILFLIGMMVSVDFSIVYMVSTLLLGAAPAIRSRVISQRIVRAERAKNEYEEERRTEEYQLFAARDFLTGYRLEDFYIGRMRQSFSRFLKGTGRELYAKEAVDQVMNYVCNYGIQVVLIVFGALLVQTRAMTIGNLTAGVLLLPSITQFYTFLAEQLKEWKAEKELESRMALFYSSDIEPESAEEQKGGQEIRLDHVGYCYLGQETPVLRDISGQILPDKNLWIRGANGSGKSTLLSVVAGLYRPTQGTIRTWAGDTLTPRALQRLVTLQDQAGSLFSGTVEENLFISEDQRETAARLLQEMGFEKELTSAVMAGGENLSPGERKKIILVRALMRSAPYLILDEPLNHLDEQGKAALIRELQRRQHGILLVLHKEEALGDLNWETWRLSDG